MSERIQVKETKTVWPSSFEGTIDDMIAQLLKLKEEGWELIDGNYFVDSYAYVFIKHRPETFDEYSNRIRTEERNEQLMLEQRRKQYEELKREFENDCNVSVAD